MASLHSLCATAHCGAIPWARVRGSVRPSSMRMTAATTQSPQTFTAEAELGLGRCPVAHPPRNNAATDQLHAQAHAHCSTTSVMCASISASYLVLVAQCMPRPHQGPVLRTKVFRTKVSVAGKRNFSAGRNGPKRPRSSRHGARETKPAHGTPPTRGYSPATGKSPLERECVVGLTEVEVSRQIKALAHRCVRNCPIERHRGISMLDAPCRRRNQLTTWSKLRMEAASRLAPYQSPKLGVVMTQPTSEQDRQRK